jgi:small subunit ribosomal protein S4
LREKQKLRFHYGLSEKQLARYVAKAFHSKGNSGLELLKALEQRLDNVVFRCGFAPTMAAARQIARHGHVTINGKKVDIPSFQLSQGDVIAVSEKSKMREQLEGNRKDPNNLALPAYLAETENDPLRLTMTMPPARDDVPVIVQEQLIVEFYSGK